MDNENEKQFIGLLKTPTSRADLFLGQRINSAVQRGKMLPVVKYFFAIDSGADEVKLPASQLVVFDVGKYIFFYFK